MKDGFRYQIIDYGLGIVETCPSFVRQGDVFWVRIKLTNESEHLLENPRFFGNITISDNWGNSYQRTFHCRLNKMGRYQPGESASETLTIDAREFVTDLQELSVALDADAVHVFAIGAPGQRRQSLRRGNGEPDPRDLRVRVVTPNRVATPIPTSTSAPPRVDADNGCGAGVTCPRVLREVRPNYTRAAMQAKIQGSVVLKIVVRPDGSVGEVQVVKSLDSIHGLDEEATRAARQWRFAPGVRDGQPVSVQTSIELTFTLR
jgi:protein TonB